MINLLPPKTREDILYARRNTKLLRWITATFIGLVGIGLVVLGRSFYINKSIQTYEKRVANAQEQLRVQKLEETQKRVQDISGSLKLVVQVLGREVLFSKLLQQIGAAMPSGASLASLSINKTQGGIDLNAVAKDYQTATQVQVNLQDPKNKIFEKAEIQNVTCSPNATDPTYPCQITLKALFAKNTPFLFIHNSKTGTKQ
jgi:Tfp pilus assembly protein PilN